MDAADRRGIDGTAVVDALPLPALLFANGILIAANTPAAMLLGVGSDAVGKRASDLPLMRRVPGLAEAIVAAARGGSGPALSVRSLATARGLRRLRLTTSPLRTAPPGAQAVLVLAEEVAAADDREESTSPRPVPEARFLATVAHELRNPLATILNALHLIRRRGRGDAGLEHAAAIAERQARHQARLLEDLLDISRLSAGKIALRPERLDLGTVVREAVEAVRLAAQARAHDLTVVGGGGHLAVRGDRTRLEQILRNLLDNAVKYTEPGGRITVWTGLEEQTIVLRVSDTGSGVDPDELTQIFEPFIQVDRSSTRSRGGLGLGLALTRALVEMHGGTIVARSAGRGRGSEFEIRLPRDAAPAAAREAPAAAAESPARRLRILVIEDNPDARELLRMVLEMDGHMVETAADGAAGVRMAAATAPDIALVDIGLPEMDGYEVARRIRRRLGAAVRLVALTGYGDPEAQRRAREAGFDEHVVKPVTPEELGRALAG